MMPKPECVGDLNLFRFTGEVDALAAGEGKKSQ